MLSLQDDRSLRLLSPMLWSYSPMAPDLSFHIVTPLLSPVQFFAWPHDQISREQCPLLQNNSRRDIRGLLSPRTT
jgi:hypothetical protein